MPKSLTDGDACDEVDQEDPGDLDAVERLRVRLARHSEQAEKLAEAMRLKSKKT